MRTTRSRLALVAMTLTLALAGAACTSDEQAAPVETKTDGPSGPACGAVPGTGPGSFDGLAAEPVATAAGNSKLLTTLATSVVEAGLADTLNGDGPFTVFAPANSAFGRIPAQDFDALLADPEALGQVLQFHVVSGELRAADLLEQGTAESLMGEDLTVAAGAGERVTVNGAQVVCADIPVANGVVHVIDQVLLPESVAPSTEGPAGPLCAAIPAEAVATLAGQPVATAASNVEQLATLTAAIDAAGVAGTLNGAGPFTVVAPVEDAFAAVPAETLAGLLEDPEALGNILTYHVIAGEQTSAELVQEGAVETLQGGSLDFALDGQAVTVNGSKVLCGPIPVENGQVFLIDQVLIPAP